MIEIWEPRYKDSTVLIATYKVAPGSNEIRFTRAKNLKGMTFSCDSEVIKACPIESNGKIDCYAVPMKNLERI